MDSRIEELIQHFNMQPHPEGGFYAKQYAAAEIIDHPLKPQTTRPLYSSIYYLITKACYSSWHRLATDEMWHFYEGDPVNIHMISDSGVYHTTTLAAIGPDMRFQYVVPAQTWFAVESHGHLGYSFTGCSLAPGFDFEDFELAKLKDLTNTYPQYSELIAKYAPMPSLDNSPR